MIILMCTWLLELCLCFDGFLQNINRIVILFLLHQAFGQEILHEAVKKGCFGKFIKLLLVFMKGEFDMFDGLINTFIAQVGFTKVEVSKNKSEL